MADPERKSPHAEATRAAILAGAIRAFAARGYEAVTMANIAAESGYSAPTLYNYFDNKEAIILALHRQVMDEYMALFDEPIPEGLDFAQRLELLTLRQTDFAHRRHDAFAVMMACPPGRTGRRFHTAMQHEFGRMMRRWGEWMRAAAGPEELAGRDPEDLAFLLWGIHHALMIRSFLGGPGRPRPPAEEARFILDFFFGGVGGRNQPRPERPR